MEKEREGVRERWKGGKREVSMQRKRAEEMHGQPIVDRRQRGGQQVLCRADPREIQDTSRKKSVAEKFKIQVEKSPLVVDFADKQKMSNWHFQPIVNGHNWRGGED